MNEANYMVIVWLHTCQWMINTTWKFLLVACLPWDNVGRLSSDTYGRRNEFHLIRYRYQCALVGHLLSFRICKTEDKSCLKDAWIYVRVVEITIWVCFESIVSNSCVSWYHWWLTRGRHSCSCMCLKSYTETKKSYIGDDELHLRCVCSSAERWNFGDLWAPFIPF